MNMLKGKFSLNGLPYTLLKRNEVVALYGIGGTYADKIHHFEVDVIYTRNDKYGEREAIADNDTLAGIATGALKVRTKLKLTMINLL